MTQTKRAALADSPNQTNHAEHSTRTKPPGKLDSMFARFATGDRLHRFQAEKIGDHCLHTTVSSLQAKYSLKFSRQWVKVSNRFGSDTRVMMYWLEGDNLLRAQKVMGWEVAA